MFPTQIKQIIQVSRLWALSGLGDAAQPNNDLADLMPRHVTLVGRLDVQRSTGRFTWESEVVPKAPQFELHSFILCCEPETSVLTAWYVVLSGCTTEGDGPEFQRPQQFRIRVV